MRSKDKNSTNRKGRRKMTGIIALVVVAALGVVGGSYWVCLNKEHREARSIPIKAVDFNHLKDGNYVGEYEGGMYGWRANKVQVTISSGKVTNIALLNSSDPGGKNTKENVLYNSIIHKQSLQVDTISGATLTSKAYLKAVENALLQAEINT